MAQFSWLLAATFPLVLTLLPFLLQRDFLCDNRCSGRIWPGVFRMLCSITFSASSICLLSFTLMMPTGMQFSHLSFSIITLPGLCPFSPLLHVAHLWVPFCSPVPTVWEVFISMFSVFVWMHSNGADGKTLLSQQETIAHGNYACCLPFHFPSVLDETVFPETLWNLPQTLT